MKSKSNQPFLSGVSYCFHKQYGRVKCNEECAFPFLAHPVDVRKGMSALTGCGREGKKKDYL